MVRLRGVLEPSWGRFGCALGVSWGAGRPSLRRLEHCRAMWRFEWRQNERFHLACRLLIDFERSLLSEVNETSLGFIAKILRIMIFERFYAVPQKVFKNFYFGWPGKGLGGVPGRFSEVLVRYWEVFGFSETVWNGLMKFRRGFKRFQQDFKRILEVSVLK